VKGTLVQLESSRSAPADLTVRQIAQLLGLEVIGFHHLEEALAEINRRSGAQSKVAFVVSGSLLRSLLSDGDPAQRQMLGGLRGLCDSFVHSFPVAEGGPEPFREHRASDILPRVARDGSRRRIYRFERAVPDSPLSGLSFESECAENPVLFEKASVPDAIPLITVNDRPLLICRSKHPHHEYLFSETPRINLDAPLAPPSVASDFYAEMLPVAFALRTIFGAACWHNPFPTGCVTVDDPLLRKKYGFFKYSEVLHELSAHQYSVTLAFIPSNFRRSDPRVASSLSTHRERFSICVHGCDHTGAEFGETDPASIENKAATALENMRQHKALTGLAFDRVMVFPQGAFSSCSLPVLKKCGYLAAVNTVPYPTNHFGAPTAIGDLFNLAILRHGSFPLFTRHYPRQVFDFAVDLFWGKPLFVVEHHDYFREGFCRLTEFVTALNELSPKIQWLTLENAVIRSGHYRSTGVDSYDVRFVTSTFVLRNPLSSRCTFLCSKPEPKPSEILRVAVDGQVFPHTTGSNHISLELTLGGGEERKIIIEYRPVELRTFGMPRAYRFKALMRRRLSEFRDNNISKNQSILNFMVGLKNLLLGRNERRYSSHES